jgi:hypothetical protein
MGEAARRKRLGFDGQKLGETVLAALNQDAGGEVWALVRVRDPAPLFYMLDADSTDARAGMITTGEAIQMPHRVVAIVLERRGEPWLEAMVFDSCEEYRPEIYAQLQANAQRVASSAMGDERLEGAWHELVTSTFPGEQGRGAGEDASGR